MSDIKFVKRKYEFKLARKILRFAAVIFPILYFFIPKLYLLILVGLIMLIFFQRTFLNSFPHNRNKTKLLYKTLVLSPMS